MLGTLLGAVLLVSGWGAAAQDRAALPGAPTVPAMAVPVPVLPPGALPGGGTGAVVPMLPELPVLTPGEAAAEAERLRTALAAEVPRGLTLTADAKRQWVARARAQADAAGFVVDRPQTVVVVDRNPRVQQLVLMVANPAAPWEVIGGTHVSTGQPNRKLYYITPTGVFLHTAGILDFRAQGTFNENGIRGYGLKGMRIWDFGWQTATKGWRADGEQGQIRLQLHATDPAVLEARLGRPASEGCVRVPAALNRFLDRHGVLDVEYEQEAVQDVRSRALLLPDRTPSPLGGRALIVVDSGAGAAT